MSLSILLQVGKYREIVAEDNVLAFVRETGNDALTMALDFGTSPAELAPVPCAGRVVFGMHDDARGHVVNDTLKLRGGEAVVVAVEAG